MNYGYTLVTDTEMSLTSNHWKKPSRSCYWSSVRSHLIICLGACSTLLIILTSLALVQRTVYYNVGHSSSHYWSLKWSSRHTRTGHSCLANCLRWSVAGEMRWGKTLNPDGRERVRNVNHDTMEQWVSTLTYCDKTHRWVCVSGEHDVFAHTHDWHSHVQCLQPRKLDQFSFSSHTATILHKIRTSLMMGNCMCLLFLFISCA